MKTLRKEIEDNGGYHLFSIQRHKEINDYPGAFNDYPGVSLSDLSLGDMITVKAYESDPRKTFNDIYIELSVNRINEWTANATILTPLPTNCPLSRGDVLEIQEDEILYSVKGMGALQGERNIQNLH